MSVFQVFPCTTQIALFWPKLLPALSLKKPSLISLPFPLRSLEIPALLKSWQRHYIVLY
jgi:hypothetical protein